MKRTYISLLAVSVALMGGAAQADKWSDQFPHIKNTGDIAGECSYEAM
jgi:multiple sugar transport system substrate-binding protein